MKFDAQMSREERGAMLERIAKVKRLQQQAVARGARGLSRTAANAFSDSYVRNVPSERDRFSDEN